MKKVLLALFIATIFMVSGCNRSAKKDSQEAVKTECCEKAEKHECCEEAVKEGCEKEKACCADKDKEGCKKEDCKKECKKECGGEEKSSDEE